MQLLWSASGGCVPSPASRGAFRLRYRAADLVLAAISPVAALYLSNAYALYGDGGLITVALYCFMSLAFSAIGLLTFRVQDGVTKYFSVHDAMQVCKAIIAAELMTCTVLFGLTRLESIPRSTFVIHSLIFGAGLIAFRMLVRIRAEARVVVAERTDDPEHILLIGSTRLCSLFIKLLQACGPGKSRLIAMLDRGPEMLGRTIEGVRIVGSPKDVETIIEEYALHGIGIDRIIVGGELDFLSATEMTEVRRVCESRRIELNFVPELLNLHKSTAKVREVAPQREDLQPRVRLSAYFQVKRFLDVCIASVALIAFLPLLTLLGFVVILDVGSPVLFWQQRLGIHGRKFMVYKFRTLQPPFDWRGEPTSPNNRLSVIGHLLRDTSLDELPQLANMLKGDMSLVGPRPLLPEDQPSNSSVRLSVRPGLTGWAQVNGGKRLTAEEKDKLDEWYIRNASISLDLRIILRTLGLVFGGGRSKERQNLEYRPGERSSN